MINDDLALTYSMKNAPKYGVLPLDFNRWYNIVRSYVSMCMALCGSSTWYALSDSDRSVILDRYLVPDIEWARALSIDWLSGIRSLSREADGYLP